ncbi:holin [Actinopolymorpha alba]|uniref:holin n=1 Tax=Actinopolymorpha alba TaxID=533267 RepID=UPI000380F8C3|nr:holin [Actinopolymorpha alba]
MLFTKASWRAAGERAIRTLEQALLAVLGANATGLLDAPWVGSLSAAFLSLLTSVSFGGIVSRGPSLGGERLPRE